MGLYYHLNKTKAIFQQYVRYVCCNGTIRWYRWRFILVHISSNRRVFFRLYVLKEASLDHYS